MQQRYLIGTGYINPPEHRQGPYPGGVESFFRLWMTNTMRYANPYKLIVLSVAGHRPPSVPVDFETINLTGDLGHVFDLIEGKKPYLWCGWSMAIMTLAMLAYQDECDFVWKEQDTLAFGPWVERMYAEIGSAYCIFGRARIMPAVQSIFLIKHAFIPEFVRLFLDSGDERKEENLGERKFARLEEKYPQWFTRYNFGYDRDRPFQIDDGVFYAQHLTESEMDLLSQKGLV